MFDLLARIVTRGESFSISYERTNDDLVCLIVQPKLTATAPDTADDSLLVARAALQRPRVWRGTHAEVEAAFEAYVRATADDRSALARACDRLTPDQQKNQQIKDAAAKASQAADDKTKSSKSDSITSKAGSDATAKPAEASAAKPDHGAATENPRSLF